PGPPPAPQTSTFTKATLLGTVKVKTPGDLNSFIATGTPAPITGTGGAYTVVEQTKPSRAMAAMTMDFCHLVKAFAIVFMSLFPFITLFRRPRGTEVSKKAFRSCERVFR